MIVFSCCVVAHWTLTHVEVTACQPKSLLFCFAVVNLLDGENGMNYLSICFEVRIYCIDVLSSHLVAYVNPLYSFLDLRLLPS